MDSIKIPASVYKIEPTTFSYCDQLKCIEVDSNSEHYTSEEGVLFTKDKTEIIIYPKGKTDSTYTIPIGVKKIVGLSFAYCENLVEIIIPNSVTYIGNCAFEYCSNLATITIPNSVTKIGWDVFLGCSNLQWIEVDKNNASYSSEKGVLFNKDKTKIIKYPEGKTDTTYEIPNSVLEIDSSAFWNCNSLTNIIIPNGTTQIGYSSFFSCDSLISIAIPDSITEIRMDSFVYCSKLSYVFYSGTQSQWENIIIDEDNSCLTDAFIHFNSVDHTYGDWEIVADFTCESSGLKKANCIICGYETSEIISAAHSYKMTVIEPSCTQDGSKTYICSVCGKVYEEILPASHAWSSEWTVDSSATCTSVGSKSHHCLYCEAKTDVTEIPMISHTWSSEWTVDLSATCTTVGSKSHHCLNCNEKTDITEIPASHTWSSEWTIDVMPTETTDGSKSHHCLYCDEKTDITVIPKLDSESPATDFKYTIKNGEVTIDKYIGSNEVMSIPSHIDGYPVTAIKSFAFSNNTTIKKAIIPYTVTDLNNYAFYNCTELLEVKFGNGITSISENCFSNCSNLQKVSLPENLITIKDGAFYYCENLTEITLPDTVEVIEEMAFYRCTALTDINIPDSTYEIGEKALYKTPWFENLTGDYVILGSGVLIKIANEFGKDVVIPEGVQTIYSDAFEESYVDVVYIPSTLKTWSMSTTFTVSAYVVNSDNPYLCVYDGILYNAEKTHLLSAPSNLTGTIILPSTVVSIGNNAFYSSNLSEVILNEGLLEIGENAFYFANTKVNIPNTVVTIGDSAFSYCYGITDVVIPQSVTNIGSWAFSGCSNLQSIHFLTINCSIYDSSYTFPINIVLYGCPNSTAQSYAEKYNREYIAEHTFENNMCIYCNTAQNLVLVEEDKHIEGLVYELNSVTQIKLDMNLDGKYITVFDVNGKELTDNDYIGTGATVYIYDSVTNELLDIYTVVLYGDVNGDGLINSADQEIITSVATCQAIIENEWFLMAADTNHDGAVDGFDVIETELQALDMHNIEQVNNSACIPKKEDETEEQLVA